MSSSGLIYAVIVGAWAAYLVPMWLRRQDELNEARPTERFSTAIRLLSGKGAMERRYAKEAERREAESCALVSGDDEADGHVPDGPSDDAVDVRAYAEPRTMAHRSAPGTGRAYPDDRRRGARTPAAGTLDAGSQEGREAAPRRAADRRKAAKRAQVLARRRRTTMVLFVCFSVGAVAFAVGGLAFLWAPAVPAALLSAYIGHLRTQERRRFQVAMDRRRAEEAAAQLRERRGRGHARSAESEPARRHAEPARRHAETGPGASSRPSAPRPPQRPQPPPERSSAADRRALVEQTDHAEWVDQERGRVREQPEGEGWEPVPVPLPTYVSAPVASRTARGADLDTPDAWSSARSTTASTASTASTGSTAVPAPTGGDAEPAPAPRVRQRRDRTPLFDQMADKDRPRAANE